MNKTRNKLWGFFRAYNCYIQRLYVFNKIRVHVTGWQFINVGRCFIKLFCWIKICFLFKNALLIKRYSFVPTKHNFLPTTNPLHLNFLLKRLEDKKGVTIYHYPYRFAKFNFHCDLYIKREHTNN